MIIPLYRLLGVVASPLVRRFLNRRLENGKEDPKRFPERFGHAGRERPEGPLVWLHAASVGESLSMLPLIERIDRDHPDFSVLLTTGTVTSAKLMSERLPAGVIHQFVPIDQIDAVRRFFDHWKPDLVLWAESEFWPNLVLEPPERGIPLILVNGRVSPKSFKGWKRFPFIIRRMLSGFSLCLGQTGIDVERLEFMGAGDARTVGNLKFAVPPLPGDADELYVLQQGVSGRPLLLGASTHQGEEEILWRVHRNVASDLPGFLTIIVPRHPDRGDEIATALRALGAECAQRSRSEPLTDKTDVYIADSMGELGLFYRLAELVFIGKSLVNAGGQNPLEAARLDCAILQGPHMWNFDEMAARMKAMDAVIEVADGDELAAELVRVSKDPDARRRLQVAAREFAEAEAGVLDAVMNELAPYFDQAGSKT